MTDSGNSTATLRGPDVGGTARGILSRHFATLKLFLVGFLGLCLLIPLAFVGGQIIERRDRHQEVVDEIGATWGRPQSIAGPVLVVPVRQSWREKVSESGQVVERDRKHTIAHYFLPEEITTAVELRTEVRSRGIFDTTVYSGTATVSGRFTRPDFTGFDLAGATVLWDQAYLALGVTDLRGTRGRVGVSWAGRTLELEPGARLTGRRDGLHAGVAGLEAATGNLPFELRIGFTGSRSIQLAPLAKENRTTITADWDSPKFIGAFLPVTRTVNDRGFEARWEVAYFGRTYPQAWSDTQYPQGFGFDLAEYGVELLTLVDVYRQTDRATKYAVLFIAVSFGLFFLTEVMLGLRIHPIQYCLVGACLILFYLLLLSLAEVIGFDPAYGLAVLLSTGLILVYLASVLRSLRRAALAAAGMAGGYAYLFGLLKLEDLSLLLGSLALFTILAAVMIATRKVDWYAPSPSGDGK